MSEPIKVGGVELTEAQVGEFREVFDLVDSDKGGSIDADEVVELMTMLGMKPTKMEVEKMIAEIDTDGNGTVDFQEFLQVMAGPQHIEYSKQELVNAFTTFSSDLNPTGTIKPEEIEEALKQYCADKLSPEDMKKLVESLELRDDGLISYLEKVNLFLGGNK